ncbi:sugar transporter [Nitzschia inconspicua]|uniref:Hexose transporter 1 n=1 Tax=Nitzschia inconspicua TaxID=303405 RepID=A0A9K3L9F5_9STRA|nr:sugar transporter [Nitzschia inconspicua]
MTREEKKKLLGDRYEKYTIPIDSELARSARSHSAGMLGGSSSLGNFRVTGDGTAGGLTKAISVSGSSPATLTPSELGRQELYTQVPFQAVFGLQRKEREISKAFANYAADLDVASAKDLSDKEKSLRQSQASMIILDEMEFDAQVVTTPLVFAIIVASTCQFLVGYNTGVMNAPEKVVFPGHSTTAWAMAVAAFAVGGPFGAALGGKMADQRGRRGAMLIDVWIFLLGGLLQTIAQDILTIIIARLIIGFASGYSSTVVPIYLGEMAPPTLRGTLGTLTQFCLVIGILIADLMAFPFATEGGWRVLFAVTMIVAILQLLMSPFLLESPRWLLNRDPSSLRARYIIKRLRGLRDEHQVEQEVGNFIIGETAQHQDEGTQASILKELWAHPKRRTLLLSSLVLQMGQQLSGINAVFYYSTSFFEGIISNPLIGTTIIGAVNVAATYVALLLMDSCGRKSLILWSSGGMFLSCIVVVLSLLGFLNNILALVAVNVYVCCFEIGLGPIPWLIVAEVIEGKYVAIAMSLCSQLNWACNFVVGMVFPYLNLYLGPYSFVPFAFVLGFVFFYALLILPETQGKTPQELVAEMARRNSQSMVYEVNEDEAGAIDLEWRKAMEQLMKEEQAQMNKGTYDYGFQPIDSNSHNF